MRAGGGGSLEPPVWLDGQVGRALDAAASGSGSGGAAPAAGPLRSTVSNFFWTDAISRNSPTMAKCVQARQQMHY